MKKMLVFFLGLLAAGETVWACTTFLIHKNGKYAFGRNYDWVTDVGIVCTNLRGLRAIFPEPLTDSGDTGSKTICVTFVAEITLFY